jgi:hypothetical protein
VIEVEELTTTPVAETAPKVTVAFEVNPEPVMVTDVPPAVAPVFGAMLETVGAGGATIENAPLACGVVSAEVLTTKL